MAQETGGLLQRLGDGRTSVLTAVPFCSRTFVLSCVWLLELIDMKTPQSCAVYAGMPFCVVAPKALGQMEAAMKQGLKMEKDIASGDRSGASFDNQNLLEEPAKIA